MTEVYLDNSATTMVCREAADKIMYMLVENYGNPSSLHTKGINAEKELKNAKSILASRLKCDQSEIYFTSGGTEANNLAILGVANRRKRLGKKIITTSIEHSSVLEPIMELEKLGFEVVYLKADSKGLISTSEFEKSLDENTILVSIMLINNELGTIQPIEQIKRIMKRKKSKALLHVDAVQAFGKIDFTVRKLGADLLSITAHKIHGPKGVGALYIKNGVLITPIMFGGEQQSKLRPGTEPIASIAGFAEAIRALPNCKDEYKNIEQLRDYCVEKLNKIKGVSINSDICGFPYIVNFSVIGVKSETMLHHLEENDVYVSSGSACSKGKKSHVLSNIDISKDRVDSAIRVSFSRYNTKEDIDKLISAIESGIKRIKRN